MRSQYRRLGDFLNLVDSRNVDLKTENLLGISIDKYFMPSVANVIGTDLRNYKLISKDLFACNPMHIGRDERLPVALYTENISAIVSPAYFLFQIIDDQILMPEYLMMWFRRAEFDRICWFKTDGSVRGGITWDDFCEITLPVPSIEKQRSIVKAYKTITDRIALKQRINEKLLDILKAIYKRKFVTCVDIDLPPPSGWKKCKLGDICSKIGSGATPAGGKTTYQSKGISLIRSTNIFDYKFSYENLAHITDEQAKSLDNVTVHDNDVLFNITGVSVARCCIVPSLVLPARVNQHVMIIRPENGEFMSYYLLLTLCYQDNKQKLLGIGQSGSTREAINKQELENFEILKPSESTLREFGRIVAPIYKQTIQNSIEIQSLHECCVLLLSTMTKEDKVL